MKRASIAACLLLAGGLFGAPPGLALPAQVKGEPGEFLKVAADTGGKCVRWLALDKGLAVFPAELLKDSRTAVVSARSPGQYRLLAMTCQGDELSEPAVCLVVVAEAAPPDPLVKGVQDAYAAEPDPAKAETLRALAALFRQAAQDAFLQTPKGWGELYQAMAAAAQTLGVAGKLPGVQKAVQAELAARLPSKDGPLDDAGRRLAASAFTRISQALEAAR